MRVQIVWIWNRTFMREKRSVNKVWTFGEYVEDNIATVKCVCVYVCVCAYNVMIDVFELQWNENVKFEVWTTSQQTLYIYIS